MLQEAREILDGLTVYIRKNIRTEIRADALRLKRIQNSREEIGSVIVQYFSVKQISSSFANIDFIKDELLRKVTIDMREHQKVCLHSIINIIYL